MAIEHNLFFDFPWTVVFVYSNLYVFPQISRVAYELPTDKGTITSILNNGADASKTSGRTDFPLLPKLTMLESRFSEVIDKERYPSKH